ncbi:MAG: isoleucine--tRNA ligase [Candidatus Moraniibacteriota bacterium]|nr:MAG: isoleucine--tRNA ligase [Candidatus Moranbacteria bacterium]
MSFKKVDAKVNFPKLEESIIELWERNKTFEKSVTNRAGKPAYVFYDGPPFATGTPHYGHIVASTIKDVVPRYWTMRGYQVERKWGWDCHGLPIENIAEKELGISHKKEIETLGVAKFNEVCRSKVLEYVDEWKKVMRRFGRWADMENAYRTMDRDFMESVWWVFRGLWDKGLIYESYRTMHICPRCETTLSQSEVAEGYKDVKDLAVTAKFELVDEPGTFVLAWTTTPWTLPGNVALAVNKDIEYVKVRDAWIPVKHPIEPLQQGVTPEESKMLVEHLILSKDAFEANKKFFHNNEPKVVEEFKGSELLGKAYKPLFDYYAKDESLKNRENGWKIYHADFVTTDMGTGIAHEAPAFGEDDMQLGKRENLPWVQHVNMDGSMKPEVTDFAGRPVKSKEDPSAMDVEIIKYLAKAGTLFAKEKYEHSYPHCWRCDTPLLNYATSSWFVRVADRKDKMIALADDINWSPEHIKAGRWGKWLEGARDWSISRQRYWASVMPLWKCDCGEMWVFGSATELEEASGQKVDDLHKHVVDLVTVPCAKCGGVMHRVPDVLDTWFDSGSMPYGERHYPFENKEKFDAAFPAQFIAEGVDQTRCWFYYLHVIATGIRETKAFQNVVVNGIVLAEDGRKMSKKLKNYPDPMDILDKYGSDVLRYYLLSSPVVAAENLNFSERDMSDIQRNLFRMLWNSYSFFMTYAAIDNWEPKASALPSDNLLDRWILSELQLVTCEVNEAMEKYELNRATRAFGPFVDNLSNWYIRRSRKRFWKSEDDGDKEAAYQTLYTTLVTLAKLMAPFTPFLAEEIYRNLTGEESVHLADYPVADDSLIDEKLNERMKQLREIVTLGLQKRAEAKIKVRQPLPMITLGEKYADTFLDETLKLQFYTDIAAEELNVREVRFVPNQTEDVVLDTNITPELKLEGEAREIIRAIQEGRKKAGFNVEDRISLGYTGKDAVFANAELGDLIAHETLATEVQSGTLADAEYSETTEIEGKAFAFTLRRSK